MARCTPSAPKKPKKTLAKPTKAKTKPTNAKGKKTPAKTAKPKKGCSGKGKIRKTKPAKPKTNRRLPDNNHFPYFFGYCCKNLRDQGIRQRANITMVQASKCWKDLKPEQKEHFVKEIKPQFVKPQKRPPPPPSSPRPGPGGTQRKLMKSDDNSSSFPTSSPGRVSGGSYYVLAPSPDSERPSVLLLVPGKSFP